MNQGEMDGALAEVASVRETADRLANADAPEDADQIRVLAGLIRQLAEQVERLFGESYQRAASGGVGTEQPAAAEETSEANATNAKEHVADAADARTH
jgi:hypothetical protein